MQQDKTEQQVPRTICGILLAAGQSQRFGHTDKLLQPLSNGLPLITQAVRTMLTAFESVMVVVPPEHDASGKGTER